MHAIPNTTDVVHKKKGFFELIWNENIADATS